VSVDRIGALVGKELREFRANPGAVVPVLLLIVICTFLPFVVVYVVPLLTGQSITSDRSMQQVVSAARVNLPGLADLDDAGATQSFLFQQFLLLFLIAPIVGAVSLAAFSVVGEKQGRTLEPLLTTPVTTPELLVAKAVASFLPSLTVEALGIVAYFGLIAMLGEPGVLRSLFTVRTAILLGVLGPFASLTAMQATIAVSSRVNDPRSAQQVSVLIVMPLVLMLVGQIGGAFFLTATSLLLLSVAVAAAWALLVMFSVALFERETVLTRWK